MLEGNSEVVALAVSIAATVVLADGSYRIRAHLHGRHSCRCHQYVRW